jgi:hypothetical protein
MLILESVALCQQPSMEVPLATLIVMAGIPPFEGHEADTRMPGTAVLAQFWITKREMGLPKGNLNALPPEQAGIHGPGTRSEHCQSSAQGAKHDVYPWIVGMREREEYLSDRQQHSCAL